MPQAISGPVAAFFCTNKKAGFAWTTILLVQQKGINILLKINSLYLSGTGLFAVILEKNLMSKRNITTFFS